MRLFFLFSFFVITVFMTSCQKKIKKNDFEIIHNKAPHNKELTIKLYKLFSLKGYAINQLLYSQVTLSDKCIYIYDPFNSKITSYDTEGNLKNTFGGKGNGPGEIGYSGGMIFANDTLYIFDNMQKKSHLFSEKGEYLYSKNYNFGFFISKPTIFNNNILLKGMISKVNANFTFLNVFLNQNFNIIKKDTLMERHFDMQKDPVTDFSYQTTSNKNNYFIAKNSENTYLIDMYNNKHEKIKNIYKTHRKVLLNKYDKEFFAQGNRGIVPKNAIYHKAINGMWADKYNRLWVLSGNDKNTSDSLFYFDIFKDGHFLNTVKFNILSEVKSKLSIEDYFFIKGDYIFIYNDSNSNFDVYNYN